MPHSLHVALHNDSDLKNLHAYVTGIAIQHNGQRCLLKANGKDLYFPKEPHKIGTQLDEDCAIPLGPPGHTKNITLPQIAGGRIWIAEGKLTFLLNPGGPALVEPSVLNPSDPNAHVNFGFCEFTLNNDQLYANISYVDFVPRIPIALTLQQASGATQHVAGMPPNGLDKLADDLHAQSQKDHRPWDKLVVKHAGQNLRVLNATHGDAVDAKFDGYFEQHIDEVWKKYANKEMKINTQAGPGVLKGHVNKDGELVIGGEKFRKPNTADVLGCNSGPFTTGPSATRNAIIPRLSAAFARSCLLECEDQPSDPKTFYKATPTNHYARLVHVHNVDGKGYAFAYDDVQPDGGEDQSGKVNAADPKLFTVTVGGKSAGAARPQTHQRIAENPNQQPQGEAPPIPPNKPQQPHGGWKEKMHGFADKLLK